MNSKDSEAGDILPNNTSQERSQDAVSDDLITVLPRFCGNLFYISLCSEKVTGKYAIITLLHF